MRVCPGCILFAIRRNRDVIRKPLSFLGTQCPVRINFFTHLGFAHLRMQAAHGVKSYPDVVISPYAKGSARSGIILVLNRNNNLKCHDFISIL
jgi:hypothetical protein